MASRTCTERFARRKRRLLADDARTTDFIGVAGAVGCGPVPGEKLDGFAAFVDNRHRIEKEPLVARRLGSFWRVLRDHLHAYAPRRGFRCEHSSAS